MKLPVFWCEIKYVCRMKGLLFWSLLLPIFLSTLFSVTLSDVYGNKSEGKIKIGIVFQKGYEDEDYFSDTEVFTTMVLGEEQAEEYLKNEIIEGYAYIGDECRLVVLDEGYEQMLMKSYLDDYVRLQGQKAALKSRYLYLKRSVTGAQIEEKNDAEIYSVVSHYDTLLATVCICAVFSGVLIVSNVRHPAQEAVAMRYLAAPVRPFWIIFRRFITAWLMQTTFVTVSYLYMLLILRIPFRMPFGYVLLIHAVGVFVSMLFGVFAGTGDRLHLSAKLGIITAMIIVGAYFSGLMDIHVRVSTQEQIPFIRFINPCTLITDAYYALYQIDMQTLWKSLAALLTIGLLSVLLTILDAGEDRHETV